jgi:hypothetical protein
MHIVYSGNCYIYIFEKNAEDIDKNVIASCSQIDFSMHKFCFIARTTDENYKSAAHTKLDNS